MTSRPGARMAHSISHLPREVHGVRFVWKASAGAGCARRRTAACEAGRGFRNCRWRGERFRQGNPRASGPRTGRDDPPARARGKFGRQRCRSNGCDAVHHPPTHRRAQRAHQRCPGHRDHLRPGRRAVHSIRARHRLAGARRRQARRSGQRRCAGGPRQCRSVAGILRRNRQCGQSDRADRPANHAARAQLHHRGRTRWRCRARLCGGCHRGQGARGADPERD